MSWLSSLGSGIKNAAVGVGHAVGSVASNPLVDAGVGLLGGPLAGAAVGGFGRLIAPGGNLGNSLGSAALGGAAGLAGNALGTSGKLGSLLGGIGSGGGSSAAGTDSFGTDPNSGGGVLSGVEGAAGKLGGLLSGGASSLLGGKIGGTNGVGGINPLTAGLAGLQTANAANLGNKANQYADMADTAANQSYNERAPLRAAGIAGLQTPRPMQDLSSLTALRNKNPVAGGVR